MLYIFVLLNSSIQNAYNQGLADATDIYIDNLPDSLVFEAKTDIGWTFDLENRQAVCFCYANVPKGYTRAVRTYIFEGVSNYTITNTIDAINGVYVRENTDVSQKEYSVSASDNLMSYFWISNIQPSNNNAKLRILITLYKN